MQKMPVLLMTDQTQTAARSRTPKVPQPIDLLDLAKLSQETARVMAEHRQIVLDVILNGSSCGKVFTRLEPRPRRQVDA